MKFLWEKAGLLNKLQENILFILKKNKKSSTSYNKVKNIRWIKHKMQKG